MSSPEDAMPIRGGKRRSIDWERIEEEYRAGQLSIREIARQYDVSNPTIVQRAKRYKWERDFSQEVRETISAKLAREASERTSASAREIIEAAAERGVDVVLRHRRDIARLDNLKNQLAEKAEEIIKGVSTLDDLSGAVQAVEGLSRTTGRLVPLERQAFNLDNAADMETGKVAIAVRFIKPPEE